MSNIDIGIYCLNKLDQLAKGLGPDNKDGFTIEYINGWYFIKVGDHSYQLETFCEETLLEAISLIWSGIRKDKNY